MIAFSVNSVVCTEEIVLSTFFSVTSAVEISSIAVSVVAFAVLGIFTFVVVLVRCSVKTASVSLVAVVNEVLVLASAVTSTVAAVLIASLARYVADVSVVFS